MRQPDDPTQTFTFLPPASTASTSRFTAVDPLSRHATSFAFHPYSDSTYDFSPFMVQVLLANGDLYAMGPIIPLRSELPLRSLQGLKAFVKERRRRAKGDKDDAEHDRLDGWDAWVDNLVKQSKDGREASSASLSRQSSQTATTSDLKTTQTVRVHPPHLTATGGPASVSHKALLRQGPLLYRPGPDEQDDAEDNVASDIISLCVPRQAGDELHGVEEGQPMVNVTAIGWSNGRVDVGLPDILEPAWVGDEVSEISAPSNAVRLGVA